MLFTPLQNFAYVDPLSRPSTSAAVQHEEQRMFAPANETHFALTIEGLPADFQVFTLQGREAISQPFVFEVELVNEKPSLDLETLLHKPAFLQLSPDGSGIHGQIYRAAQGDSGKRAWFWL
jgi:type VI secretion system secreted protein VgrG